MSDVLAAASDPATLPLMGELPGRPEDWALFLDLDGTLIDIASRPEEVVVPPDLLPTLAALAGLFGGAIAIVTGRKLADVDALLGPIGIPVAALHGSAVRIGGKVTSPPEVSQVPGPLSEALLAFVRSHPGLLLEPKGESVAVHYRNAPPLAGLVETTVDELVAAWAPNHDVQPGKMVVEIKPRGVDKGRAIAMLLQSGPFCGRKPAVFGDDLTDEAGFLVARSLGGLAAIVGSPARPTAASARLTHPGAMRHWLAGLAAHSLPRS